jgi:hypothetical protein
MALANLDQEKMAMMGLCLVLILDMAVNNFDVVA